MGTGETPFMDDSGQQADVGGGGFGAMTLPELREQAAEAGVPAAEIAAAENADDPRAAVLSLLLLRVAPPTVDRSVCCSC